MLKDPWNLNSYHYDLPPELIAHNPVSPRDQSRLLVFRRQDGSLTAGHFTDLLKYLEPGDVLVLNETKVLPARLLARRPTGGKAEILLLQEEPAGVWEVLGQPGKAFRPGSFFYLDGELRAEVLQAPDGTGRCRVRFNAGREAVLARGVMPLPPYIKRPAQTRDGQAYQTVYARQPGAVAAPTAGLHFSEAVLQAIQNQGVAVEKIILHVGPGTFIPVKNPDIRQHRLFRERFEVPAGCLEKIRACRQAGRKAVAVGTTVVRALETAWIGPLTGETGLFIYPSYSFRAADALLTNFHLPGSTLLMLVAAFLGPHDWRPLYQKAIQERFRFYSYGDAMLIL